MTSEGLGEMFEGDTADMCGRKFPLMSMGSRGEGLACADPGARTPIGVSGIYISFLLIVLKCFIMYHIFLYRLSHNIYSFKLFYISDPSYRFCYNISYPSYQLFDNILPTR